MPDNPRAFGGIAPRKSSSRDQKWLLPHHSAKYHVEYMLYISLYLRGEQNWPNTARWNQITLDLSNSREIQLRPRCIMESVNGSLNSEQPAKIKKCQISVHVVLVSNRSCKMVSAQPKQFENDFFKATQVRLPLLVGFLITIIIAN